jgi:hypothetical protein
MNTCIAIHYFQVLNCTPFTIEINRANSVLGSVMVSLATQYLDDLDKYRYRGGNSQ